MYDISNNSAPRNVMDLFTQVATVHSYNTKSSTAGNYQIKSSRTNQQHNAFSRVGAKVWNSVPEYLRNLKKKDFTRKIHTLLIETINNEDDYVDLCLILFLIFHGYVTNSTLFINRSNSTFQITPLTRNTCMQQPLAYIFQTLTYMKYCVSN